MSAASAVDTKSAAACAAAPVYMGKLSCLLLLFSAFVLTGCNAGAVTTPAGSLHSKAGKINGEAGKSQFFYPKRMCSYVDPTQNNETVYLITEATKKIRCYNPKTKLTTDWMDVGAAMEKAGFSESNLLAICVDPVRVKSLYLSDWQHRVWRLTDGAATLITGGKDLKESVSNEVSDLLVRSDGTELFACCSMLNCIRAIDLSKPPATAGTPYPMRVVCGKSHGSDEKAETIDHDSDPLSARLALPESMCWIDPTDESKGVWIGQHLKLRQWSIKTGRVSTIAGDSARSPDYVRVTPSGHALTAGDGIMQAVTNDAAAVAVDVCRGPKGYKDGEASKVAQFSSISALAISSAEKCVYALDGGNHCLRRIELPDFYFTSGSAAPASEIVLSASNPFGYGKAAPVRGRGAGGGGGGGRGRGRGDRRAAAGGGRGRGRGQGRGRGRGGRGGGSSGTSGGDHSSSQACFFFQRTGICSRGDTCAFAHVSDSKFDAAEIAVAAARADAAKAALRAEAVAKAEEAEAAAAAAAAEAAEKAKDDADMAERLQLLRKMELVARVAYRLKPGVWPPEPLTGGWAQPDCELDVFTCRDGVLPTAVRTALLADLDRIANATNDRFVSGYQNVIDPNLHLSYVGEERRAHPAFKADLQDLNSYYSEHQRRVAVQPIVEKWPNWDPADWRWTATDVRIDVPIRPSADDLAAVDASLKPSSRRGGWTVVERCAKLVRAASAVLMTPEAATRAAKAAAAAAAPVPVASSNSADAKAAAVAGDAASGIRIELTSPIAEFDRKLYAGLYDGVSHIFARAWPALCRIRNWQSQYTHVDDDDAVNTLDKGTGDGATKVIHRTDPFGITDLLVRGQGRQFENSQATETGYRYDPSRASFDGKWYTVEEWDLPKYYYDLYPNPFLCPQSYLPASVAPTDQEMAAKRAALPPLSALPSTVSQSIQVVVKSQRIVVPPGKSYKGLWHDEGLHEHVIAVVIYYTAVPNSFASKRPQYFLDDETDPAYVKPRSTAAVRQAWKSRAKTIVPITEGGLLVWSNYQTLHRVMELRNDAKTDVSREFVCLFVIDPRRPLNSTSELMDWRETVLQALSSAAAHATSTSDESASYPRVLVQLICEYCFMGVSRSERVQLRNTVFNAQMKPKRLGRWMMFRTGNGSEEGVGWLGPGDGCDVVNDWTMGDGIRMGKELRGTSYAAQRRCDAAAAVRSESGCLHVCSSDSGKSDSDGS